MPPGGKKISVTGAAADRDISSENAGVWAPRRKPDAECPCDWYIVKRCVPGMRCRGWKITTLVLNAMGAEREMRGAVVNGWCDPARAGAGQALRLAPKYMVGGYLKIK